jgi:hypothetical protein
MATNAGNMIVSEVLCVVQYRMSRVSKVDLMSSICDFYTVDEIVQAKKTLYDFASSLKVDYIPHYSERKGANRLRASVEDLLALYTLLDANKAKLPQFVAANPLRVLPMSPATVPSNVSDISALAALVYELREQVAALTVNINELRKHSVNDMSVASSGATSTNPPAGSSTGVQKSSWADLVMAVASDPAAFQLPAPSTSNSTSYSAAPKKLIKVGKRLASSDVKAVPRPLVCFVGRLDPSTTAEGLHDYLEEVGIMGTECRKLEAKNGKVFKTAAFRVSCPVAYRELFCDEANWPDGAELRDWVFRQRTHNGAA